MNNIFVRLRENKWFERVYSAGVILKGIDGSLELLAGLALLIAPNLLHYTLMSLLGKTTEHLHGHIGEFLAVQIAKADGDVANGIIFLIIFLLTHGIVKLVMVYCLLKRILWAYPYALLVLTLFLVYQIYIFVIHPTVFMGFFVVLDVLIIGLVWGEWQKLRSEAGSLTNNKPQPE